ncbi:MAG: type II secretion system protein GspG [Planctomycetota bacterium]|nr:type II secretion system protein GspG [Planctomycetota bacterium]
MPTSPTMTRHETQPQTFAGRSTGARSRRRAAPGFSLIELTLVIVILGVLMGVVAINVLGQGEKAKIRATEASMDIIRTSLESYHLEYSDYPSTLSLLQSVPGFLSDAKALKDGWDRDFYFRVPGNNNRPYDLSSVGADVNDLTDDIDIWTMNK